MNEPVSSVMPAFRELIAQTFANHERVVLLFRYAYCAGAKDYFVARSPREFDAALMCARAKTSITVFFERNFTLDGIADDDLCGRAIALLPTVYTAHEGIDLIRMDGSSIELDGDHYPYATNEDEIREWFSRNRGSPVLVGTMEFWHDNCPKMVTVYVPDDDGVVRSGAY